jgi:hypothetical protein
MLPGGADAACLGPGRLPGVGRGRVDELVDGEPLTEFVGTDTAIDGADTEIEGVSFTAIEGTEGASLKANVGIEGVSLKAKVGIGGGASLTAMTGIGGAELTLMLGVDTEDPT